MVKIGLTTLLAFVLWAPVLSASVVRTLPLTQNQFAGTVQLSFRIDQQPGALLAQGAPVAAPAPAAKPGEAPPSGNAAPSKENKPGELKKKEGDAGKKNPDGTPADKGEQKPQAPEVITRPLKPEEPADPRELDASLDEQGRVRFNFARQSWPAILEWLAKVSHLSLDWQELPADYLNLHTQRDYSIDEARDLINRHLLARGFTMLKSGEMLTVVSIAKLNASMVPRVQPEELSQRLGSEFVKVSFPLKWMLAEKAVEELKPMLSANGKLFALKEINRIEALDAASNLRDIHQLLQQSQSEDITKTTVVREFRLQHRRASEVVLLVESILGLDPKRMPMNMGRGGGGGDMMSFQIMNQLQQMQQQMQQGQRGGTGADAGKGKEPDPRLIVNDQENSILAHATPDKLEIISQTIKAIDVPGDEGNQLLHSINRVKPYRLSTADPQPIMAILKEMGNLSPQSRIQIDEKSKSLILFGTLSDHYTTQALIERLDGTNRNFEVVTLRRLHADAVAGTIQYLMGAEDEDKDKNSNNRYSYFYGYQQSSSKGDKEERPFKVDADIVNNRLLLWANDVELEEVRNLLVKMGETPPGKSNPDTMRTLEFESDQEAEHLLERLKQLWPDMETNPLQIQKTPVPSQIPSSVKPAPQTSTETHPLTNPTTKTAPVKLAWWQNGAEQEETPFSQKQPAESLNQIAESTTRSAVSPIAIQRLPDGRIVYSSSDTEALDRLEDLINHLSSPLKDYHVFQLKYPTTWAYGIESILTDFFEDKSLTESTFDPWYGTTQTKKVNRSQRLSRQKELKIISDEDSHTILVQGATAEQLKVIAELIDLYDRKASNDPQAVRKTEVFQLQYSKAPAIAEAVKQVYRDLLSANDPALQSPNQQQKPSEEPKFTYIYGRQNTDDKEESPAQPIKFKGLLSVGIDEISNTIIVSSTEGLMRDIRELINRLDQAARPSHTVQVLQVRNISPEIIQQRLGRTFSSPGIRTSETGQRNKKPENDANRPGNPTPNKNAQQGQQSQSSDGNSAPNQ